MVPTYVYGSARGLNDFDLLRQKGHVFFYQAEIPCSRDRACSEDVGSLVQGSPHLTAEEETVVLSKHDNCKRDAGAAYQVKSPLIGTAASTFESACLGRGAVARSRHGYSVHPVGT